MTTIETADGGKVRMFFPAASELNAPIRTNIPCPQSGCNKIFKQPAALRFHMEKVHKVKKEPSGQYDARPEKGVQFQFFCPVTECPYYFRGTSQRRNCFPNKKNLRMHYLRCHMEKQFKCFKAGCTKAFSVEQDLRVHAVECGQTFACAACDSVYDTSKAYLLHCRRKLHPVRHDLQNPRKILAEAASVSAPKPFPVIRPVKLSTAKPPQPLFIAPKPDIMILSVDYVPPAAPSSTPGVEATPGGMIIPKQVIYVADARTSEQKQSQPLSIVSDVLSKGDEAPSMLTDTDRSTANNIQNSVILKEHKCTRCGNLHMCDKHLPRKHVRTPGTPKSSAGTQTSNNKRKRIVAQTQTTGDFILRKAMQCADIPIQKESRGSQVSPRAKLKRSHSAANLQTSQTQTVASPRPVKKRRRKKHVEVQDTATTTTLQAPQDLKPVTGEGSGSADPAGSTEPSTNAEGLKDGYTLSIADNPWMSVADTETQTMALLDELQTRLGESHSTQTLHSYLLDGKDGGQEYINNFTAQEDISLVKVECKRSEDSREFTGGSDTTMLDIKSESTVDQAVFCDLKFDVDLATDNNTRSMACSPIFNMTSSGTMDIGTDPLFDPFLLTEGSGSFGMSAQDQLNCVETCDANIGTAGEDFDFPVLLTSGVQTSDFDGMCMNIETQTMENDSESMIDQLLTNMQTQTSDDFLVDFSFCDIETQTTMTMSGDIVVQNGAGSSVASAADYIRQEIQTQTSLGHPQEGAGSTDTHTQTLLDSAQDASPNLADSFTQTAFTELENIMDDLTK